MTDQLISHRKIQHLSEKFFNYVHSLDTIKKEMDMDDSNTISHRLFMLLEKIEHDGESIESIKDFNRLLQIDPMNTQRISVLIESQDKPVETSFTKLRKENESIIDDFTSEAASDEIEISKKENMEDAVRLIKSIQEEQIELHKRAKFNSLYLEKHTGKKIMLCDLIDVHDIFHNESMELDGGQSIKDSTFIKRAEILRKHIHMTEDYPLMGVKKEIISELNELKTYYPNFSKVIDEIIGYAILSLMNKNSFFYMKPILLAGDPGVGKTSFAQKLASILNLSFHKLSLITCTASWTITGMDLSWSGGKPGKIFEFLSQAKMANPLIMLDELDKGSKDNSSGGNPIDTLHELLEKETSRSFQDEAMLMEMDASYINWIATANILENIPESIISRFKVFHIKNVGDEDRPFVIRNVFKGIVNNSPNKDNINPDISDEIVDFLKGYNIRSIATMLESALGHCAKRHWFANDGSINDKLMIETQDIKEAMVQI
jgi:ATP-dependent Lon protease